MTQTARRMDVLTSLLSEHLELYAANVKENTQKLAAHYVDQGISTHSMSLAFDRIANQALNVWIEACDSAAVEIGALKARISESILEVESIRIAIGEHEEADLELHNCIEESNQARPRVTLRSLLDRVLQRLEHYTAKKYDRMAQYSELIQNISASKVQLGLSGASHVKDYDLDLSTKHLDRIRSENEGLVIEKEKRLKRLDALMLEAVAVSAKIGEDPHFSEIHHSLKVYHQDKRPGSVDLSEAMLEKLVDKIKALNRVAEEREQEVDDLFLTISNLFVALNLQSEVRREIEEALSGSTRLWQSTIALCHEELHRLETQAGKDMKTEIVNKSKEIERLSAESLMPSPDLSQLLSEMSSNSGNVGVILSKMMRILADTSALKMIREPIVDYVKEVETLRAEMTWLTLYEADANRYKGKDATKNIARATRAQNLRLNSFALLETTSQAIHEWHLKEGSPFLVRGDDYAPVVRELSEAVEKALADKPSSIKSTKAGAKASAPPPPPAAASYRSTQKLGASPALPNLSHQTLSKRHSIAFVDGGSSSASKAPSARGATVKQPLPARPKAVSGGGEPKTPQTASSQVQTPRGSSISHHSINSGSQSTRHASVFSGSSTNPLTSSVTPVSKLTELLDHAEIDVQAEGDQAVKRSGAVPTTHMNNTRSRIPRPV